MEKITLMIAEDQAMFREMLALVIKEESNDIDIIGLAANGLQLLELVKQKVPDVVLLDLKMPELDGQGVLKVFEEEYPQIKTIILSNNCTNYFVAQVALLGAKAFIDKGSNVEEVLNAIRKVQADGFYFNKIISQEILDALHSNRKVYYMIQDKKFSEREIEVLKEICNESTIEQIADNLHISVNTVQFHKNNLKKKTESDNIVSLIKYAIRNGIVDNDK